MTDIAGNSSTTATISVGGTVTDSLETVGDHDWFAITLTAGQPVVVTLDGATLEDPYLYIRDSFGNLLFSNDDIVDGVNRNSQVAFDPTYTGTYYIDVGAFNNSYTGTYQLSVQPYTPPPVATVDQIAQQLTTGYWGGDTHNWAVTQGGSITVNISTLNPSEQNLARSALQEWSDIIGVHFQEVTTGGQIVFDHTEDSSGQPIAATDGQWSNGIISSEHVHISTSWVNSYGTGLDTYSFQTYVHEIGHALGLGHAGNYNETATYPYDALFKNDGWPLSVMSYFSQSDNPYYGNPEQFALTPMGADIVAMQSLYGLSTTTRTGDTTYGYHSNAGGIFDASVYPNAAYAIFDNGGTDTLDFSGSPFDQRINLNSETFSDVNGHNQDLYVARGVTIENAIGGSGNDTITQNAANNVVDGGAGNDTLSYETATAGVTVDLRLSTAQDTGGAGIDTITNIEGLIGTAFADTLIAGSSTVSLTGGAGDDWFDARAAAAGTLRMSGGDGNDTFVIGTGPVWIDGGTGFNIVDAHNATAGVDLGTDGRMGSSPNTVYAQEIIGSNYADSLWAMHAVDVLYGGGGDDTLTGWGGAHLVGGLGNDTYDVWDVMDQITESPGEGIDTVVVLNNYTLGANLENLTLAQPDPYAGASIPSGPIEDNWTATGNDLANVITGNLGNNVLTGLGGTDTLTGGGGNDTFLDTKAGLNGDTITDFGAGDKIVFSDATLAGFTFSLTGNTLTYTGGSLTLGSVPGGHIVAQAASGGGVQLTIVQHEAHNDFNGDGRSDILWRSDTGALSDWLGTASGGFAGNDTNASNFAPTNWHVADTGDFNGDGRVDILWRSDTGALSDWLGTASGGFANNDANAAGWAPTNWTVVGTGDFNGDGKDDILWRSDTGALSDWLGTANGGFTSNDANAAGFAPTSWHVVGTGDFNGDGKDDILWRSDTGALSDWLGTANGGFTSNDANASSFPPTNWTVAGTGDFNGDGKDDILWRNTTSGALSDWLGTTSGGFANNDANAASSAPTSWHVASIGDFNGDGRADILWRSDTGALSDWLGTANGGFINNDASAASFAPTSWHIQDPLY